MILVFQEDGRLWVANDETEVYRACEGIDVQSGAYKFYDDSGNALKPVFDAPVKKGKWWSLWSVDSGVYHLEADLESTEDPLWVSFLEVHRLEPNERFATLEELKAFVRKRGAVVDHPAGGTRAE